MVIKRRLLLILLLIASLKLVVAQAPNISYIKSGYSIAPGVAFSISPVNSGGAVPATVYGDVKIFVGAAIATPGYQNGPDTSARLNIPQQMVQDASGNFYVVCSGNNGVREITPAGVVSTFAGDLTGLAGLKNGTGTSALFYFPDGLAIDGSGNLYVAEYNNNTIRKITPDSVVTTFYAAPAPFGPAGLCFDNSGNLIVTAQDANQIIAINPSGIATVIAGSTTAGYVNGPVASAQFNNPTDVRVDGSGNMYIVDYMNNAVREITPGGIVSTIAGSDVSGNKPGYANGIGTAAIFNNPAGLVIGAGGVIYIADINNHDIRRIMPDGTVSLLAGSAVQATGDSDGIGTAAGFNYPVAMYIDNNGVGYISEFVGARIRKIILTGYSISGTLPPGLTFDPTTGTISGTPTAVSPATSYTVTGFNTSGLSSAVVNIGVAPGPNTSLIGLKSSPGTLSPAFKTATTAYSVSVGNAVASIQLTPTTSDSTAIVTINGSVVASGALSPAIPLSVGSNSITISVVDNGGTTESDYTVTVTRAPSNNANLSTLGQSAGGLTPAFSTATTSYTINVSNTTASITLKPVSSNAGATITVNGAAVASGTTTAPIALTGGAQTVITTVVTAQDGTTTKTYTLTVTRALSANANLATLGQSIHGLTPAFSTGTISYTDNVSNATASMMLKPVSSDANATIQVNGTAVTSGTVYGPITLAPGANTVTTVVTAQNGTTSKTYTLTVTRAAGPLNRYFPIASETGLSIARPIETPALAEDGIMVHQGISPNGDGVNDFLVIENISRYPDNKLSIMNRNGQLIYEAKGYDNNSKIFDGHSNKNGQMQLPGTYFYQLDYTVSGIIKHKTGFIVLKY